MFAADGTPVNGSDFLVSTQRRQSMPQITALADGGFAVTWTSWRQRDIRGRVFAADGTPVNGSDFLVSTTNAGYAMRPQITALADGGFAVTWVSRQRLRALTFGAGCSRRTARRSTAAISWFLRSTPESKRSRIHGPADHGAGGWRLRGDVEVVERLGL